MIISALTAAAAAAVMGGAGMAAASTHAAVSGTEHFQMMTTTGTGSTGSVIASGVFTAPAVDHEHDATNTSTFTFSNGTILIKHSNGGGGRRAPASPGLVPGNGLACPVPATT
jgi:hypothetical protein